MESYTTQSRCENIHEYCVNRNTNEAEVTIILHHDKAKKRTVWELHHGIGKKANVIRGVWVEVVIKKLMIFAIEYIS